MSDQMDMRARNRHDATSYSHRVTIACALVALACAAAARGATEIAHTAPQDGKIAYALVSLHWATYQTPDGKPNARTDTT